jgi:flagellar hook assembly protein FlgD
VTTLLDKDIPAGIYDLTWKGTDENGQKVASGTYIFMMKAISQDGRKHFTTSRKMTIIR